MSVGGPAAIARPDVAQAYVECQEITKAGAKNFYFAFLTLPRRKRLAIYAAYAFCRMCDDIADGESTNAEKAKGLQELRDRLIAAYSGNAEGPVFTALADAASRFKIPQELFENVVKGVEMDLRKTRYRTFEELREYCYYVASTVGLIAIYVFEFKDSRAVDYAVDLGIAMQLTNIMRDIEEDAAANRIYLPQEDLERFGYSETDLLDGIYNDNFKELMRFEAGRARAYFERGQLLYPLLNRRVRACPKALETLYTRILDRMEEREFNVFGERVSLSTSTKLSIMARLWLRSLIPVPGQP